MKNNIIASISILLILLAFNPKGYTQTFIEHSIDQNFPGISSVKIVDLDLDGDFDVIGGSEHTPYSTSKGIVWWRNGGGYPIQWTRFTISNTFKHVMSIDVGCIDNDTLPDIVASSWENGKISWWKNSGNPTQNWSEQIVVSGWTNAHDAVIYDIDNDGNNDIIGVSAGDNKISVFYNQLGEISEWNESIITTNFSHVLSVNIADLNDDGFPDIISGADGCDNIAWWENSGENPANWQKKIIANYLGGAGRTDIVDINFDGQLDVIGAGWEGNEISYWICNDISTNSWIKTLITNQLGTAVSGLGSDIDMDGDIDIIAVGKNPGKLAIYTNVHFSFRETILNSDYLGGAALSIIDIDNDGDDDIISGAGVAGDLFLYENTKVLKVSEKDKVNLYFKAYPNPFIEFIRFDYNLQTNSNVLIKIYDTSGKEIKILVNSYQTPGAKTIVWNGTDNNDKPVPSGMYYCKIQAGVGNQSVKKLILN